MALATAGPLYPCSYSSSSCPASSSLQAASSSYPPPPLSRAYASHTGSPSIYRQQPDALQTACSTAGFTAVPPAGWASSAAPAPHFGHLNLSGSAAASFAAPTSGPSGGFASCSHASSPSVRAAPGSLSGQCQYDFSREPQSLPRPQTGAARAEASFPYERLLFDLEPRVTCRRLSPPRGRARSASPSAHRAGPAYAAPGLAYPWVAAAPASVWTDQRPRSQSPVVRVHYRLPRPMSEETRVEFGQIYAQREVRYVQGAAAGPTYRRRVPTLKPLAGAAQQTAESDDSGPGVLSQLGSVAVDVGYHLTVKPIASTVNVVTDFVFDSARLGADYLWKPLTAGLLEEENHSFDRLLRQRKSTGASCAEAIADVGHHVALKPIGNTVGIVADLTSDLARLGRDYLVAPLLSGGAALASAALPGPDNEDPEDSPEFEKLSTS